MIRRSFAVLCSYDIVNGSGGSLVHDAEVAAFVKAQQEEARHAILLAQGGAIGKQQSTTIVDQFATHQIGATKTGSSSASASPFSQPSAAHGFGITEAGNREDSFKEGLSQYELNQMFYTTTGQTVRRKIEIPDHIKNKNRENVIASAAGSNQQEAEDLTSPETLMDKEEAEAEEAETKRRIKDATPVLLSPKGSGPKPVLGPTTADNVRQHDAEIFALANKLQSKFVYEEGDGEGGNSTTPGTSVEVTAKDHGTRKPRELAPGEHLLAWEFRPNGWLLDRGAKFTTQEPRDGEEELGKATKTYVFGSAESACKWLGRASLFAQRLDTYPEFDLFYAEVRVTVPLTPQGEAIALMMNYLEHDSSVLKRINFTQSVEETGDAARVREKVEWNDFVVSWLKEFSGSSFWWVTDEIGVKRREEFAREVFSQWYNRATYLAWRKSRDRKDFRGNMTLDELSKDAQQRRRRIERREVTKKQKTAAASRKSKMSDMDKAREMAARHPRASTMKQRNPQRNASAPSSSAAPLSADDRSLKLKKALSIFPNDDEEDTRGTATTSDSDDKPPSVEDLRSGLHSSTIQQDEAQEEDDGDMNFVVRDVIPRDLRDKLRRRRDGQYHPNMERVQNAGRK